MGEQDSMYTIQMRKSAVQHPYSQTTAVPSGTEHSEGCILHQSSR